MSKPKLMIIAPHAASFVMLRMDLAKDIMKNGYEVVVVAPKKDNYEARIELAGMKYRPVALDKNSLNPFNSIKYKKALTKIILEEKPNKIFAYTSKPVIFGSLAAHRAGANDFFALVCGLGSVYADNSIKNKILQTIMGVLYKKAFQYSKKIIFQNKDDLDEFTKRKYLSRKKCELVNGSGVDMEKFKYKSLPPEPSFIMVSRIIKEKGVKEYFEAAGIVKKQHPEATFTYIGDYDKSYAKDFKKLQQYINSGVVNYIPTTDKVADYVSSSQVSVLPSYYREGVPRTLLEALSVGRPIITTNTPGCKETIVDKQNGLFVKTRSIDDLVEKMMWVIDHQDKLPRMSKQSYELCKKKFAIDIINKGMITIIIGA